MVAVHRQLLVRNRRLALLVAHHWIHSSKPLFLIASGLAAAFHAIKLWSIAGGARPEIFVKVGVGADAKYFD
jgi:hypothetical protein